MSLSFGLSVTKSHHCEIDVSKAFTGFFWDPLVTSIALSNTKFLLFRSVCTLAQKLSLGLPIALFQMLYNLKASFGWSILGSKVDEWGIEEQKYNYVPLKTISLDILYCINRWILIEIRL